MSRISLTDVLRRLDEEFNEAEELYSTERLEDEDDIEDLRQIDPLYTDESLVVDQPLLESSVVECFEDVDMISVAQNQSGLSEDVVMESSGTVGLESSVEDEEESRRIDHFIEQTCGCTTGLKKSPCSSLFSRDILLEYRGNC